MTALAIRPRYLDEPRRKPRVWFGRKPKTKRPCLLCGTKFMSEGAGHRVCDHCKGAPEWQR